jgi:putative addiction module CopG family antidote
MNISLPSELKRFVAQKIKDGLYASEDEVVRDALQRLVERDRFLSIGSTMSSQILPRLSSDTLSSLGLGGGDVEALAFIVLMQATQDMDGDLKMIMAEIKAMAAAKTKLRELISKVRKDVTSNAGQRDKKPPLDFSRGLGSQQTYHRVKIPYADPESEGGVKFVSADLFDGKLDDVAQLKGILDDLKDKLDGMNEMSEMTSLRLQMMMDRRSKFISTLYQIMKHNNSSTLAAMLQNLK